MTCKYFRTIQLYQDDETEDIETDLGDNEDVSQPENEDESLRLQPYSGTRRIVPIRKKVKRNNNRFYDNLNPSSNVLNSSRDVSILTDNITINTTSITNSQFSNPIMQPEEMQFQDEVDIMQTKSMQQEPALDIAKPKRKQSNRKKK